jgi:aldose 1-epimerase
MQRKYFGTTSDGIPVHIFHLESQSGVAVRVMEYGASLVSIETPDRYGRTGPIVLGYDELSGYLGADSSLGSAPNASVNSSLSTSLSTSLNTGRAPACGATLGRYAGRIGDGAFRLSGSLHTVSKDDGSNRPGAGAAGLHRAVWWGEALSEGVRFHYRSPAGAEGYPGALDCSVEYRLDSEGELRLDYRATTDAPTVLDLTSQIYFNLNDAGRSPVIDHELTISADEIVETDREGVPTGHYQRIVGSTLDFSSAKRLGEHVERPERSQNGTDPFYPASRSRPRSPASVSPADRHCVPSTGKNCTACAFVHRTCPMRRIIDTFPARASPLEAPTTRRPSSGSETIVDSGACEEPRR